ncbi:MAG: repressor LexA [Ignavibacteriaceae bacterium]|nr:repressor LexA [Ignavibacteriaceae bacterium]
MTKPLSPVQKKILDFLLWKKEKDGIPPTLAEIAEQFGYKNRSTVKQHLEALHKKKYIRKIERINRGIEILKQEEFFKSYPLHGEVAAGDPILYYNCVLNTTELPTALKIPSDSFLLRVRGDSMKDAYIFNGDVLIVKPSEAVLNGQLVVGVYDDSALVKKIFVSKDSIELHPENSDFKPIVIRDKDTLKFRLVGVVVGIYRTVTPPRQLS